MRLDGNTGRRHRNRRGRISRHRGAESLCGERGHRWQEQQPRQEEREIMGGKMRGMRRGRDWRRGVARERSQVSRDHGRLGAAGVLGELRDLERDVRDRLDHVEGVLGQVGVRSSVLLEVHPNRRAGHTRAGEAEDEARPRLEDEAHALVLRDGAVDGVVVLEHVRLCDLHAVDRRANQGRLRLDHRRHHLLGGGLVDALVVVPRVVVAPILLPVLLRHVADADDWLGRVGVLGGQDLQPREHRKHAVLLSHVVSSSAEGLLAADEGGVDGLAGEGVRARVHQVAKELPPGGHLEVRDAQLLGDPVEGARGWHRARAALEPGREVRDAARVRDDDGERIARRAEEARPHDHVAVGVAVGRRAEDGRLARRLDLAPLLVESHPGDQLDRVRQVGVRVAVRRRGGPAEVLLWLAVHQRRSGRAKLVDEDLLGVRALHAVHPVVHEAEVLARKERLDGPKVEHLLEQAHVVLDAVEDVDAEGAAAERVRARRGQVNFGQAAAELVLLDGGRVGVDEVRHLLRRRAAILAVVLDAKVLVDAARVVRRGEDEAAERRHASEAARARADHSRHGRRREQAVIAAPDSAHACSGRHLDDDLDGGLVVVAAVAGDDQRAALDRDALGHQSVERRLHKILQVVLRHERLCLLPQAGRAGLLPGNGARRHGGHFHALR
mmetsp:Transcript_11886/g.38768  ORF Transcript_11886/g.38768 Transcript_11886/m.38768 type:complete len:668 (+) Transcript_11886:489-2492(+)